MAWRLIWRFFFFGLRTVNGTKIKISIFKRFSGHCEIFHVIKKKLCLVFLCAHVHYALFVVLIVTNFFHFYQCFSMCMNWILNFFQLNFLSLALHIVLRNSNVYTKLERYIERKEEKEETCKKFQQWIES